ncbi:replication initiator protein A [Weissella viridescens]|uniref:replication initiator protein A n=1 Tax=Weissella viridescens TaxID=1629 RepID=UPI003AF277DD
MERIHINQVETSEHFFQMPKVLFTDDYYKNMSLEAKTLYTFMKDRTKLSKKHNYIDDEGNVYILYTNETAAKELNCGLSKAKQIRKELIKYDLIEVVKSPTMKRASWIYVGNLQLGQSSNLIDETALESNGQNSTYGETPSESNGQNSTYGETPSESNGQNSTYATDEFQPMERSDSDSSIGQDLTTSNTNINKTNKSNTDTNKTDDDDTSHLINENETPQRKNEITEISNIIQQQLGMTINPGQQLEIRRWLNVFEPLDIIAGIDRAALYGGHTMKYIKDSIESVIEETKKMTEEISG